MNKKTQADLAAQLARDDENREAAAPQVQGSLAAQAKAFQNAKAAGDANIAAGHARVSDRNWHG
jgi:hypothetical protein